MSVTSTRKVSASYSTSVKGGYEAASGRQSFVETIDTTNSVLVADDTDSRGRQYFSRQPEEQGDFGSQSVSVTQQVLNNDLQVSKNLSPLFDNDEVHSSVVQDKSVGIYGSNQAMSSAEEKIDNPYLKHLYEENEVIEDVDKFI